MGFSRETFYRYQKALSEGGVEALLDKNKRVPNFNEFQISKIELMKL